MIWAPAQMPMIHYANLCDDDDDDDTHIYSTLFVHALNVCEEDSSLSVLRNSSPRINFLRLLEVVNLWFVEKCLELNIYVLYILSVYISKFCRQRYGILSHSTPPKLYSFLWNNNHNSNPHSKRTIHLNRIFLECYIFFWKLGNFQKKRTGSYYFYWPLRIGMEVIWLLFRFILRYHSI